MKAFREIDADAALRTILEGTAPETGERFFEALVENLARALGADGAWVTEYLPERKRLRALAFWLKGRLVPHYEYDVAGTPCERVIERSHLVNIPENVIELFPADPDLKEFSAVSYLGVPLKRADGGILGHLAVVDSRPMPEEPRVLAIFRIFAGRAAAELRRLGAEAELRDRERKLAGLLASALDAVVEIDGRWRVTMVNPAAEKLFRCGADEMLGAPFARFLTDPARAMLETLVSRLEQAPEGSRSLWIPQGLEARRSDGERFPAECSLSAYEVKDRRFYLLILRNVDERVEAERRIRALTAEAEHLREEIRVLQGSVEIIGESEVLRRVLRDAQQVAETEATVLILGETGTGKELIARAVHQASRRRDKPLVKVNCGAIPANLMESEFFGHEKGAFTGATERREGRFVAADGGSLFLDEVGELPLQLQVKLLRVLQEGELEPVGSSRTRKVDVRILAATNRDLERAVREGSFREDLYYRLNVFPISIPPLRERKEDIGPLALALTKRIAERLGRKIEPPSAECIRRLEGYGWPGNVRELANVIERAVITSRDGRLNLDRALPEPAPAPAPAPRGEAGRPPDILTAEELLDLEKRNLMRALEASGWRVSGPRGAAERLGMNPSTLSSRMKALGIERPGGA